MYDPLKTLSLQNKLSRKRKYSSSLKNICMTHILQIAYIQNLKEFLQLNEKSRWSNQKVVQIYKHTLLQRSCMDS